MSCHRSRLFFRANPDRAGAADQRERIVADNFRGPFQLQLDGIVRKRPDGAKFVGHAQNDASGIGAIGVETRVVGQQREFLIDTSAGHRLNDHLLAIDVALDSQVSPLEDGLLKSATNGGIAKVGKLGFVWIGFRHQLVGNIKFQVVAVRADQRLW